MSPTSIAPFQSETAYEAEVRVKYFAYQRVRDTLLKDLQSNKAKFWEFRRRLIQWAELSSVLLPRLVVDSPDAWLWRYEFLANLLEPATVELIRRLAKHVVWAIDGGAHIGYYARHIESSSKACAIFAVEAHPRNMHALRRNVTKQTKVVHAALFNQLGTISVFDGRGHSNSSLLPYPPGRERDSFAVPAITVDSLLPAELSTKSGIIKLDIEGFELEALNGAAMLLRENADVIVVAEINPRVLRAREQPLNTLNQFMEGLNFEGRMIDDKFCLHAAGWIEKRSTSNYLYVHRDRWPRVKSIIFSRAIKPDSGSRRRNRVDTDFL